MAARKQCKTILIRLLACFHTSKAALAVYSVASDCQRGRRLCGPSDKRQPITSLKHLRRDTLGHILEAVDGDAEVLLYRFKDAEMTTCTCVWPIWHSGFLTGKLFQSITRT
jgi:hypothetical protein